MRSSVLSLVLFLILCAALQVCADACPPTHGLSGTVLNQTHPQFNIAIFEYNQGFHPVPCVLVFCQQTQDVVTAMQFAMSHGLTPVVRSGRHSYMAYSVLNNSVVIDVSQMSEIDFVDNSHTMVKMDAGVRLIEAYDFTSSHNLIFPGGSCPSVGLSGFVLGGGYGFWVRKYGLAIDSLVAVEIVLPTGQLVVADADNYPDLFWALRGGGNGNFGVAVTFMFNLPMVDANQPFSTYQITWRQNMIADVINAWQKWYLTVPPELTPSLSIQHDVVTSFGMFVGDSNTLNKLITPLLSLGLVQSYNVQGFQLRDAILNLQSTFNGCFTFDECRTIGREEPTAAMSGFRDKSNFVNEPISPEGISILLRYMQGDMYIKCGSDCDYVAVEFDGFGGAVNTVPFNGTAFPHRNMLFHMQIMVNWLSTSTVGPMATKWTRDFYSALQVYVAPHSYWNYIDGDIVNWPSVYFADNFKALQHVKAKYDPKNVFHYPQSIPLP